MYKETRNLEGLVGLRVENIRNQSLFWVGLALRLSLILCAEPVYATIYFAPFIDNSLFTLTPWSSWLQAGGSIEAFPYGYAMWIALLPLASVMAFFNLPVIYGYLATLLITDLCLLLSLRAIVPNRPKLLLIAYWCSPVVILATYGMGLNDIIPAFLLMSSILLLKANKIILAGILLATAFSAKISMVVAAPLILIYLNSNNMLRPSIVQFFTSLIITTTLLFLPFLASQDASNMLFGNPQFEKVLSLAIDIGDGFKVYVVPLGYLLILYAIWRIQRLNYELLMATLALTFLFMVLTTTGSPAWFIWSLPFLVIYQSNGNRITALIVAVFTLLFSVEILLKAPPVASYILSDYTLFYFEFHKVIFNFIETNTANSIIRTALIAVGVILGYRVWRDAISENNFFKISRSPFLIGVAGDSGSGKDTFANSIVDLFGNHSAGCVHGDDYHLWDRKRPVWNFITHLNPMANDIDRLSQDVLNLKRGHQIRTRHYNHKTGMISKPRVVNSNDLIIVSGLHSLSSNILRESYNLSIYLDMEERLREYFKIKRDMFQRGYTRAQVQKSIERRKSDAKKFIKPQKHYADLILSIRAVNDNFSFENYSTRTPRLALSVETRSTDKMISLHRKLVGLCGLQVDVTLESQDGRIEMLIEGEVLSEDIAEVVEKICPDVMEFLDRNKKFHNGALGLMQLVTICHIDTLMKLKRST